MTIEKALSSLHVELVQVLARRCGCEARITPCLLGN